MTERPGYFLGIPVTIVSEDHQPPPGSIHMVMRVADDILGEISPPPAALLARRQQGTCSRCGEPIWWDPKSRVGNLPFVCMYCVAVQGGWLDEYREAFGGG